MNTTKTYEGRPCPLGHTTRYAKGGACVECMRVKTMRWRHENKEHMLEFWRSWRASNPASVLVNRSRHRASRNGHTPLSREAALGAIAARKEILDKYGEEACWCCGIVGPVVCDHDHISGAFRAWLCRECNSAEGLLGTVARAKAVLAYMEAVK